MLTILAKLFQALHSENSTRQIAAAVALALIFALSPLLSLQAFFILFVVLLIRVHLASFLVAITVFEGVRVMLNTTIINIGESLLTTASLQSLFTGLYQFDVFKLAQLHHTFNLGALILGVALAIPLYFVTKILIDKYREHIKAFFERLAIVKALKASRVFAIYQELPKLGGRA
ncbi:TIGR03546 family protein [Thalassotalea euphylliae]|uniref:TIGR03546 family protein n=1 Tax=Thalassotalea euphylliae TaxID=1655234 RepID=A0A3E0UF71_9GAMM|nr:TIGR03546 family protein [Thalassotalea euphylliae]REL34492.1 TIGR03546 family protein [Thalassotalea euphylliae]